MHGQIDRTLSIPIYKRKCPVSCGIRPPSFHCGGIAATSTAMENPLRATRNFWSASPSLTEHPARDRPGRQQLQQRFSTRGVQGWAERAETPVRGPFLLYFAGCFQDFNKNLSISLCSLRMDKRCTRMYNKARNQRSTAEAQMRANPADLKQKGARPMVDMEPAQQGQAVGIR